MTAFKLEGRKDIKNLARFMDKNAKLANRVIASTLNTQAFANKKNNAKVLGKSLVIRNVKFTTSSLRVKMAKKSASPDRNFSISGSIERARFSGWEEQQTGKTAEGHRRATSAARKGNFQDMIFGKARLKASTNPLSIRDIKEGNRATRTVQLLTQARKQRRSFIVSRRDQMKVRIKKRFKPGLYGFQGNNLMRLQTFGKQYKPKKIDWMGKSLRMTFRDNDFFHTFVNEYERIMRKQGAR